jgi:hypothetical protein
MNLAAASPLLLVDWPSLGWVALIAALTFATLTVKARYDRISEMGRAARALAHVTIGYFGVGMTLFGAWSAVNAHFPVPGGAGWEGGLAIVGGLAAVTIGSCTLGEHAVRVAGRGRVAARVTARG